MLRFCAFLSLTLVLISRTSLGEVPDKAAPFTGVRWEGDEAVVRVDNDWYYLEKLDDLTTAEIVTYTKDTFGRRWRKRFSEDLVEVLEGMGHKPNETVSLTLRKDGKTEMRKAQMTEENRRSAWQYNQDSVDPRPQNTASVPTTPLSSGNAYEQMAQRMAEHMDTIWDSKPTPGEANIRILMTKDGKPFAGIVSIQTEFRFSARSSRGQFNNQGMNPNANGRWVYEGLEPGTYDITITGNGRFEGWSWTHKGVTVKAGEGPLFEVEIDH